MTVYNRKFRCEGGQKKPARDCPCCDKGECSVCGKFFMLYPNGKVVMHKRKFARSEPRFQDARNRLPF